MMTPEEIYEMGTLRACLDIAIRELSTVTADEATDTDRYFAGLSLKFLEDKKAELEQKRLDKQPA